MKGVKEILKITGSNFLGWPVNQKLILTLLFLAVFVLDNFSPIFDFAEQMRYRVSPCLLPFCFTHPFMKIVIFSCVIFLFADAPFMSELHLLLLSRTGKRKWHMAQILYLIICSVLYTCLIALLPVVRHLPLIALTKDWGRLIRTMSVQTDIVHPVMYSVVQHYSQRTAMFYTMAVCALLTLFLGMILCVCNTLIRNREAGILATAFLVLLDWFVYMTDSRILLWISPVSWIQISNMAYARERGIPSASYAVTVLLIADAVLILLSGVFSARTDVADWNDIK